ncbi:MAG: hypothetical protein UDY71_01550, partial [Slackia isoflavoniconvertens]|nr:hypothetical protein [Slackia isoflavoniconvertens]
SPPETLPLEGTYTDNLTDPKRQNGARFPFALNCNYDKRIKKAQVKDLSSRPWKLRIELFSLFPMQ